MSTIEFLKNAATATTHSCITTKNRELQEVVAACFSTPAATTILTLFFYNKIQHTTFGVVHHIFNSNRLLVYQFIEHVAPSVSILHGNITHKFRTAFFCLDIGKIECADASFGFGDVAAHLISQAGIRQFTSSR